MIYIYENSKLCYYIAYVCQNCESCTILPNIINSKLESQNVEVYTIGNAKKPGNGRYDGLNLFYL